MHVKAAQDIRAQSRMHTRAGICAPRRQDGYQFAVIAERLASGHPYTTTAACAPLTIDAAIAEQARNTPDAVANPLGPEPAIYLLPAAALRPPAGPFTWLRPYREWRTSYAQRHEHTTAIGVAA